MYISIYIYIYIYIIYISNSLRCVWSIVELIKGQTQASHFLSFRIELRIVS